MASVRLTWSLERWGTTPRDVDAIRPGVSMLISVGVDPLCLMKEILPRRGPNWEVSESLEDEIFWNTRERDDRIAPDIARGPEAFWIEHNTQPVDQVLQMEIEE